MSNASTQFIETLGVRERYRDDYWESRDPIADDRLCWRAQTFRHMMHVLPSQSILELGCGHGRFTRQLFNVTRGENPITAVSFGSPAAGADVPKAVEFHSASALPGELAGRTFDFVVGADLLDKRNCGWLMQHVYGLLKPGGQVLFYESNPWNVVLKLRRAITNRVGARDPRSLLSRPELAELISEIGFIRVFTVYNDFVFRPVPRSLMWLFRNLSVLLENAAAVRTLAGAILVHAQKPPRTLERPAVSLFEHEPMRRAVSVVIPCHNEEMNIGPMVRRVRELFGEYLHEIIPVEDNSTDSTRAVIEALAVDDPLIKPIVRRPPNGVGRAIIDGYRAATGRYVLSMDCDFQHLLPEVRDLFDAAAEGHDVVIGSRFSRGSVLLNYPFKKIVANRGFHLLARLVLWRRFRDLTNNLKLIRRDVIDRLQLTEPGFAINAETGLQPVVMGCSVKEVPISWINRGPDMGMSSFRIVRVGGGYCRVLAHLWLKCFLGIGPYKKLMKRTHDRRTSRDDEKVDPVPSRPPISPR